MNKMKKLISFLLIALLAFLMPACSCAKPEAESEPEKTEVSAGKSDTEKEEKEEAGPEGEYEITAMITDGEKTSAEDLELLKSRGLTCTIILSPDGTGILNLFGEETELTWDEKAISTAGKKRPYTWQDGQLTLTDGNSSLTFTRTETSEGSR